MPTPKVLSGLPRRKNTAWLVASRALPRVPPADCPSVRKIIVSAPSGLPVFLSTLSSLRWFLQSLSCGTRTDTACACSRAFFLIETSCERILPVSSIFAISLSVSAGERCSSASIAFFISATSSARMSFITNLIFVCPSKTGFMIRIDTAPIRPSRMSSPSNFFFES